MWGVAVWLWVTINEVATEKKEIHTFVSLLLINMMIRQERLYSLDNWMIQRELPPTALPCDAKRPHAIVGQISA